MRIASYSVYLRNSLRKKACQSACCRILPFLTSNRPRLNRGVATWSSLANAFNTKQSSWSELQTALLKSNVGLFQRTELASPDGFYLMKTNAMAKTEELVNEAVSKERSRKMVQIFDDLSDSLCQVADLAEFVRIGHPKQVFAQSAEEACLQINNLVEKLNTNQEIFKALQSVVENGDKFPTDEIDEHVAKLFLFDFEQCGIHLNKETRKQVVYLNEVILRTGSFFVNGTALPRTVHKSSLPDYLNHCFSGGDTITIGGLVNDYHDETLREISYRVFLAPDAHQEYLLEQILQSRNELAQLCGFESYAQRAVRGSLAEDPNSIELFLQKLSSELKPRAKKDYNQMLTMKRITNPEAKEIFPWDVPYFTSQAKQSTLNIRSTDYCPYFSLGACMEGLNHIFQSLYDVTLEAEPMQNSEAWHTDVIKLSVKDKSGILGYIYCDFYERADKPVQECHFTIRGGRNLADGTYQIPIVTLLLNLPAPKMNTPSCLTPSMLDNLFHEMGHAMHSMLARTKYQHVTGTRCSTDLAEVPSVLMEYFASDYRVISRFARHFKTGEPIPSHLLNNLSASKQFFSSSETQLQVFYAALDQALHANYPLGKSNIEILAATQNNFYGLPYVENTAWYLRFGHLVGYGAKYYSYLVSRSVASWIWHQHFAKDPFSKEAGQRFRQKILEHGGSKPPKYLVEDFLDQDVNADSLAKALLLDVDRNK